MYFFKCLSLFWDYSIWFLHFISTGYCFVSYEGIKREKIMLKVIWRWLIKTLMHYLSVWCQHDWICNPACGIMMALISLKHLCNKFLTNETWHLKIDFKCPIILLRCIYSRRVKLCFSIFKCLRIHISFQDYLHWCRLPC